MNSETEENKEDVVNSSGINTQKLRFPNDNPADYIEVDALSKAYFWKSNCFIAQGINTKNMMDAETGRKGFSFKKKYFMQQKQSMLI